MKRLLYNLHNEVFETAESRINTEHSLTTREGVSHVHRSCYTVPLFPHYTCGCIACSFICSICFFGSLTTREGVSSLYESHPTRDGFPHYT